MLASQFSTLLKNLMDKIEHERLKSIDEAAELTAAAIAVFHRDGDSNIGL